MRNEWKDLIAATLEPRPRLSLVEWAEANIVLPPDYQSPIRGQFSLDRFPIFKELLAEIDNPDVAEIVLLKCSQLGFSQNVLLPLALKTLWEGYPVIVATGTMAQAEAFAIERLKPLIFASPAFEGMEVREREGEIYLPNGGLLTCIHQSSKAGQKTRPAKVILADELDIWANNTLEKLRSRTTHYYNSKVIIASAPDGDAKTVKIGDKYLSPIFAEYEDSTQAKYFLTKEGESFVLDFGFRGKDKASLPPYGLKWNEDAKRKDGTWNESRIAETVRYVSPNGQTITESERDRLLDSGKWIHSFPDRKRKGYHANCLYIKGKSFASVACSYVRSKRIGGLQFRTWLLENFAEDIETEKIELSDRTLRNLTADYKRGSTFPHSQELPCKRIMGVDVQQVGIWWICVDVAGDSIGVVDWGYCFSFADIDRKATELHADHVAVDVGYDVRRPETYEAAGKYSFIPVMGRPRANFGNIWEAQSLDPMSGRRGQGQGTIWQILFQSETVKTLLFECISGISHTKLYLPADYLAKDSDLELHLTAETFEDGKFLEKRKDNHLLDCLTYAFMLAKFKRYLPA